MSRRARRCTRSSRTRRPGRRPLDRRGVPRRAWERGSRQPDRDRGTSAASVREQVGCRSRSASRGRSSSRRWQAALPSRTACSQCRPIASSCFSTRSLSSGSGASAPSRRQAAAGRDHDCRPGRGAHGGDARLDARAGGGPQDPRARDEPGSAPVEARRRRGSIGGQRALGRSRKSAAEIDVVLLGLVDRITRRMRTAGRVGRTVVLRLRFDDFSRATRSSTLQRSTRANADDPRLARGLLATAMPTIERRGLTLVGMAVCNLENDFPRQLIFPFDGAAERLGHGRRRDPGPLRREGDQQGRPARPRSGARDADAAGLTSASLHSVSYYVRNDKEAAVDASTMAWLGPLMWVWRDHRLHHRRLLRHGHDGDVGLGLRAPDRRDADGALAGDGSQTGAGLRSVRSGRARWPSRSSKPVRSGNPRLGRFDSCAAPLSQKFAWLSRVCVLRGPSLGLSGVPGRRPPPSSEPLQRGSNSSRTVQSLSRLGSWIASLASSPAAGRSSPSSVPGSHCWPRSASRSARSSRRRRRARQLPAGRRRVGGGAGGVKAVPSGRRDVRHSGIRTRERADCG